MDVRFFHLGALHWLWAVVGVALLLVIATRGRRQALARFASASLHARLLPGAGRGAFVRAALVVAALVGLVAAMIDPRWGVRFEEVQQRGIDVMVVLDVSRSMEAGDARPSRLERARQNVRDLVDELAGDRVGLVTFAGTASVKCPLTVDYGAFLLSLDTVSVESASRGGSLLGDALRVAAVSFTDDEPDHKVILVFSDGEDHGSYPLEAARKLREEHGIPVYTFGIGDPDEGARIPIVVKGRTTWLEYEGEQVWSKMNPTVLRDIALACGGAFVPVGTGSVDMTRIFREHIEPVTKRAMETTVRERHEPRYQWFAGLALALLLIESLLGPAGGGRPAVIARSGAVRAALRAAMLLISATALGAAPAAAPTVGPPSRAPSVAPTPAAPVPPLDTLRAAQQALQAGRWQEAIDQYEQLRPLMPGSALVPYNQGVAAHRAGAYARAAEYFDHAQSLAVDPALRARAAYNMGTSAYAQIVNPAPGPEGQDPGGAGAAKPQDRIKEAMATLETAQEQFRRAIDLDPASEAARANGELAERLLDQLRAMAEQNPEQSESSQDGDPSEQEPSDGDQGEQGEQGEQSQQNNAADSSGNQEGQPGEPPPSEANQNGDDNESPPSEPAASEPSPDEPPPGADSAAANEEEPEAVPSEDEPPAEGAETPAERRAMTPEEARRLLQGVRDKERRRREELERRQAAGRKRVDRDW